MSHCCDKCWFYDECTTKNSCCDKCDYYDLDTMRCSYGADDLTGGDITKDDIEEDFELF